MANCSGFYDVLGLASDEARDVTSVMLPVGADLSTPPPGVTLFIGQALAGG